jgi:hypothetical protein
MVGGGMCWGGCSEVGKKVVLKSGAPPLGLTKHSRAYSDTGQQSFLGFWLKQIWSIP